MSSSDIFDVLEATWPPLSRKSVGDWIIREGAGGGKRVSAATPAATPSRAGDIAQAEEEMRALHQDLLFSLKPDETELDTILAENGYDVIDPTVLYHVSIKDLGEIEIPPLAAFPIWEPLQIMRDIWAKGGIGPARNAVMERATCTKTGLFGRHENRPSAAGYVGVHDGIAMVHALEVLARDRRKGMGRLMMQRAARWAQSQGARQLAVICTAENTAANALYTSMGFTLVGHYHYRIKG